MADREKIVLWCKAHATQLFLGGMAALVVVRGGVQLLATAASPPEMPPIKTAKIEPIMNEESEDYKRVAHLIKPRVPFQNSEYRRPFVTNDMFDPKTYKTDDKIKQQANDFFIRAKQAYDQAMQTLAAGNPKEAQTQFESAASFVDHALERQAVHVGAQKLRGEIRLRLADLAKGTAGAPPAAGK